MARAPLRYFRSEWGGQYLATREHGDPRGLGILFNEGNDEISEPTLLGSIDNHVAARWHEINPAEAPELMRRLVDESGF